jgi:inorganic triphosphatase YgiF
VTAEAKDTRAFARRPAAGRSRLAVGEGRSADAADAPGEGFGPRLRDAEVAASAAQARRREVELKLEIRPSDIGRVTRLTYLPAARLGQPRAEQLFTVYFDTDACALRKAGLSLRLRHAGTQRIQSVKSAPRDESLAADRAEDEVILNGKGPDISHIGNALLREQVSEAAGAADLRALFETQILRTTRHIKTDAGDDVELVVDVGQLRADRGDRPLAEVELELKGGRPEALYKLARALNEEAPLRVLTLTKADRGYELLGEAALKPAKADTIALAPGCATGEALKVILRACLGHLMANEPATVERQDVEGLHQMRVALRRLRTAFDVFEKPARAPPLAPLAEEARWLSRCLGEARDLDVFKDEIMAPAAKAFPDDAAFGALAEATEKARALAWTEALTAISSARYTAFVLDLAALIEHPGLEGADAETQALLALPARSFAGQALDTLFAAAEKLGKKLPDLEWLDCHRLRRRLKRLRYAAEFFLSLYPEGDTAPVMKRLARLQNTFGALNDAATAQRIVDMLINKNPQGLETLAWAGGVVVGWHQHTARAMRKEGARCWQALCHTAPFWREA